VKYLVQDDCVPHAFRIGERRRDLCSRGRRIGRSRSCLLRRRNGAAGQRSDGVVELGLELDIELVIVFDDALPQAGSLIGNRPGMGGHIFCHVLGHGLTPLQIVFAGRTRRA
jgi:hypothetical protein